MFINSKMIYVSATQRLKSTSPKIEPCGAKKFEKSGINLYQMGSIWKSKIKYKNVLGKFSLFSFFIRMLKLLVSKALIWQSLNTDNVILQHSSAFSLSISTFFFKNQVFVELFFWYPDWYSWYKSLFSMEVVIYDKITFTWLSESMGKTVTGR